MMRASLLSLLAMFSAAGFASFVSAQQVGDNKTLMANFNNAAKNRFVELMTDAQPSGTADSKVLQAAAQYYIYRITHRAGVDPKEIVKVQAEFDGKMIDIMSPKFDKSAKNNRASIRVFGPKLVDAMTEVLAANPVGKEPITTTTAVQAGAMLSSMARLKDESIDTYITGLIKNANSHDVIRLYAIKAIKESMPISVQPDDLNLIQDKGSQQQVKRLRDAMLVDTLRAYIEDDVKRGLKDKSMTPDELAAVRYLRREAIAALAHAGAPAVLALKKGAVLQGPVAPTLIHVLVKGGLDPTPSLQEKIEAAVGLCNMKHPNMPEYDPSIATYYIGKTILELVDDYNRELAAIAAVGAGKKIPYVAYRTDAKRLADGLTELARNYPTATPLKRDGQKVLDRIVTKAKVETPYPSLDNAEVGDLRRTVQALLPKSGIVFKSQKGPGIPLN